MTDDRVVFRRIRGRIVPIRGGGTRTEAKVAPTKGYGTSVKIGAAAGALGAAGVAKSKFRVVGGQILMKRTPAGKALGLASAAAGLAGTGYAVKKGYDHGSVGVGLGNYFSSALSQAAVAGTIIGGMAFAGMRKAAVKAAAQGARGAARGAKGARTVKDVTGTAKSVGRFRK